MRLIHFVIFLFIGFYCFAQDSAANTNSATDTVPVLKNNLPATDTSAAVSGAPSFDSCRNYIISKLLRLNVTARPEMYVEKEKEYSNEDWLFYYVLGLLLLFGLLRLNYSRYLNDLFRVFFRTSLKINQLREQLLQSGLQSLFFNIFFTVSLGTYSYLLIRYFRAGVELDGWLIAVGASVVIAVLYVGKYVFLQLSGWLFGVQPLVKGYTFIVFLITKVAGIAVLPFIILIAFGDGKLATIAVTVSLALVTGLYLYRFLRAYSSIQPEVKVDRFHFFIYFLAFEVAPILLIYKVFIRFL
jgi:hypothetical protein